MEKELKELVFRIASFCSKEWFELDVNESIQILVSSTGCRVCLFQENKSSVDEVKLFPYNYEKVKQLIELLK